MKKISITTAALLLSIATNCVTAAYPHHGNDELATRFHEIVLPTLAALAKDPSFRGINHHEKVRGVQTLCAFTRLKTFANPNISVKNMDTIAAVIEMLRAGLRNPAILNLANKTIAGGGVRSGSKAQEEDLCRLTSLYESIMAAYKSGEYPLKEFEAIYSPKVWSLENIDAGSFAAVSMAGYRAKAGRVDPADYPDSEEKFREGMKEKIRVILSTLITRGHTNIVLGALGCGAFAEGPTGRIAHIPTDVATAFSEVLNSEYIDGIPYANHFENIVFAILENPQKEFLNPIFRDALRTAPQTSTVASAQPTPSQYAAVRAATSDAPSFDTSIANVERLFKEQSGLRALFSGPKVTIEFIEQKPWAGPRAALPVKVNSYSELNGGWTIHAFFANGDHIADIKITGHWQSLDREARAWLSAVTEPKPSQHLVAAAPAAPRLNLTTLDVNGKLSDTTKSKFFVNARYTPQIWGSTELWTRPPPPWPVMIKSYTVNRDGGFTLIAIFAHSGSKGEWYTTPVRITGSPSTLSEKAKEWLAKHIK